MVCVASATAPITNAKPSNFIQVHYDIDALNHYICCYTPILIAFASGQQTNDLSYP